MSQSVKSPMSSSLASRRVTRFAPFASLLALAACSSVLGIEDVHQGPAPGSGGGTSSGGSSNGGSSSGGSATMGGDGAVGATSGASTINGGSGGEGQGGGSAGSTVIGAGGDQSGEAGAAGASSGGTPVTGHVIDFWGHKIAGVPVEIGGTKVTTDAQGTFVIPEVAAEYDASLVVEIPNSGGEIYGWVYQGLTRRDPTLQVYAALESQSISVDVNATGSNVTLTGTRKFSVATAGLDGADEFADITPDPSFSEGTSYWRGSTSTQETAHGLIWQPNANGLPTGYVAYDAKSIALSSTASSNATVTLDMTAKTIAGANVSGTITPGGTDTRANYAFIQFPTNAAITVVSDYAGPNTFSYLMPTIANSSIMVAAAEGDAGTGAFAVAHKDGLAPGKTGATLQIPIPASHLAVIPAASLNKVDAKTQFTFQPGAGNTGPYVIQFFNGDSSLYDGLYIITTKTTFTLPKVLNDSFALVPGDSYYWRVQTHGVSTSVDAMAAPNGFMDAFSGNDYNYGHIAPLGPRHGDGAFTISGSQLVKLAP